MHSVADDGHGRREHLNPLAEVNAELEGKKKNHCHRPLMKEKGTRERKTRKGDETGLTLERLG